MILVAKAMDTMPPLLMIAAGRCPRLRRAAPPRPREIKLHLTVAKLLDEHILPDWRWHHVPNGEKRDIRTAARLKAMGVKPGVPDFEIFAPGGQLHALEIKRTARDKLTPAQEKFRDWCYQYGCPHRVEWTVEGVLEALDLFGCLRIRITQRCIAA